MFNGSAGTLYFEVLEYVDVMMFVALAQAYL